MKNNEIKGLNASVDLMDANSEQEMNEMFEELSSREEFFCLGDGCSGKVCGLN